MKRIRLKPNGIGRYDDVSPYIIADGKLKVQIALPNFNGNFYIITENRGSIIKKLVPLDGIIELDNLSAGELNAEVRHYLKGEIIKTYKIEPLLLKELEGVITVIPEIEELNRRLCGCKRSFEVFKSKMDEYLLRLEKDLKFYKNKLLALVRFVSVISTENPFVGEDAVEKFVVKFCDGFSKEDTNFIKGENGNDED